MKFEKLKNIPTLTNYKDWYEKALYGFKRYNETCAIYDLTDCLLTLNALPEWIIGSNLANESLKELAKEKISIMKSLTFDELKLSEIDQQLRFIRIFCNHSKHAVAKEKFPKIEMAALLPAMFPIGFEYIKIGDLMFPAKLIIKNVLDFWGAKIDFKTN